MICLCSCSFTLTVSERQRIGERYGIRVVPEQATEV